MIEEVKELLKNHINYFNKPFNQFQNGRKWEAEKILDFINDIERQTSTEVPKQQDSKALHIADVVRSVCSHEKTPIINNEGNTIGRYCSTCDVFYNSENVGLKC